jgi:hypothetical protein
MGYEMRWRHDVVRKASAHMTEEEKRLYAEQTWFATTTGALNGLLVKGMKSISCPFAVCVKLLSLGISLYAAFLVIQRSATAEH